jgi:hypothetical protein
LAPFSRRCFGSSVSINQNLYLLFCQPCLASAVFRCRNNLDSSSFLFSSLIAAGKSSFVGLQQQQQQRGQGAVACIASFQQVAHPVTSSSGASV